MHFFLKTISVQIFNTPQVFLRALYKTKSVIFSDICQLRLDFDNFDITETTAGVCTDSFAMTAPSGQNPLNLCGTLTDFHSEWNRSKHQPSNTSLFVKLVFFYSNKRKKSSIKTKLNSKRAKGSISETEK